MKKAQEVPDRLKNKLAKGFFTVYIANQMGVTFKTAEKYASDEVGGLWLFLADLAVKSVNESLDEAYNNYLQPTDAILSADFLDDSE
jgi:hypothetical protein